MSANERKVLVMKSATVYRQKLRELRDEKAWTLVELANEVKRHYAPGVTDVMLSMIERGERQPSSKLFNGICAALGVDRDVLLVRGDRDAAA